MARTNLGKVSVTPRGEWVQGTMYARLDVVSQSGGSYMSVIDNNYSSPGTAGAWMQVAKIGKDGRSLIVLNNGNIGYWDSAAQQWVDTGIAANTATLDPSNIGLTDVHTNINSLDNPTLTMQDPEDPSKMVVKTLATLDDIPEPSPTIDLDVSSMFTANVELTHFAARMVQYPGKLPFIRIFCEDTSGEDNTLTLTVARGFGSFVDHTGSRAIAQHYIDTDGSIAHDTITITPETQLAQSVITVSPNLHEFNITYWVGNTEDTTTSYWVDTAGIYHVFTAANTSLSNLSETTTGLSSDLVTIEGLKVAKNQVVGLQLGAEYSDSTHLPSNFLRGFAMLRNLNINALVNIETTGDFVIFNLHSLDVLDIYNMNKIRSIGSFCIVSLGVKEIRMNLESLALVGNTCIRNNSSLTNIDLSTFTSVQSIGTLFLSECVSLSSIQLGSVDWSTKTVGNDCLKECPNVATSILYADTHSVADAFKSKFPNVSNWTVVINETPVGA